MLPSTDPLHTLAWSKSPALLSPARLDHPRPRVPSVSLVRIVLPHSPHPPPTQPAWLNQTMASDAGIGNTYAHESYALLLSSSIQLDVHVRVRLMPRQIGQIMKIKSNWVAQGPHDHLPPLWTICSHGKIYLTSYGYGEGIDVFGSTNGKCHVNSVRARFPI